MPVRIWLPAVVAIAAIALPIVAQERKGIASYDPPAVGKRVSETPAGATITADDFGFRDLVADDFAVVNSEPETWTWKDGVLHCTGEPLGVLRTKKQFKNFELIVEWMHERAAGNSGVFVWVTPDSIRRVNGKPGLPDGIEVQILDHGLKDKVAAMGKDNSWFATNGDVFPVRVDLTPFPPLSPDGSRSFPRRKLANGHGNWNQYYVRAINGEVRLWVNGREVSGGTGANPADGYLCLESEGSPIQFRTLRIRELP